MLGIGFWSSLQPLTTVVKYWGCIMDSLIFRRVSWSKFSDTLSFFVSFFHSVIWSSVVLWPSWPLKNILIIGLMDWRRKMKSLNMVKNVCLSLVGNTLSVSVGISLAWHSTWAARWFKEWQPSPHLHPPSSVRFHFFSTTYCLSVVAKPDQGRIIQEASSAELCYWA